MKLEYGAFTHKGNVRKLNEDYYYIPSSETKYEGLIMVADGMGGHKAGDLASRMVVENILKYYEDRKASFTSKEEVANFICEAILRANSKVFNYSKTGEEYHGMGTTLTLAYFYHNHLFIGHVGDSRGYLVRDGQVKQLTRDHSLVQELLENGTITQEQVENHPRKNIITRALGTDDNVDVDCYEIDLKDGDILILCTDGLTRHVNLSENSKLFASGISMAEIATILGQKALEDGGTDNITVVATQYSDGMKER